MKIKFLKRLVIIVILLVLMPGKSLAHDGISQSRLDTIWTVLTSPREYLVKISYQCSYKHKIELNPDLCAAAMVVTIALRDSDDSLRPCMKITDGGTEGGVECLKVLNNATNITQLKERAKRLVVNTKERTRLLQTCEKYDLFKTPSCADALVAEAAMYHTK